MSDLVKNYIDALKLNNTSILVVLDGVYQLEFSDSIRVDSKSQGLTITRKTKVDKPFHLLFLNSKGSDFRFEITVEDGVNATVIEEHESLNDNVNNNSNMELNLDLKNSSKLLHYRVQLANSEYSDLKVKTTIKQAEQSSIDTFFISKGSKKYLDQIEVKLLGQEAAYNIKGISLLGVDQVMDQKMRIEHLAPNCSSNVLSKVVVDDRAINSFDCLVLVPTKITKTEAHVNNRNLLLSEEATANSSPELEVYVDDVVCTHGSTIGQLDQDAIFYLRSRGITKEKAEQILISGFIKEIMNNFSQYPRFVNAAGVVYE